MKSKIILIGVLVLVFVLSGSVYAVKDDGGSGSSNPTNQGQQQTQLSNQGEDSQIQLQNNEQSYNGDELDDKGDDAPVTGQQNQEKNKEQEKTQQDKVNAEEHRSVVANFVQSLLQVADREGGIGEQVRTIAQQQNQAGETTAQAMEKVQTRSRIRTFFFGSDYKNLGVLRSEMAQTQNRLEQVNRLMENVQNDGDQVELQNQVQLLEQEQTKIEEFIKTNEDKFSLFGWFTRLFNK